jgi:hypothetical protein
MAAPVCNTTNTLNVPVKTPMLDANGNPTKPWTGLFKQIGDSDAATCDTHANRVANFTAATRDLGQFYYEVDRNVLYIDVLGLSAPQQPVWQYMAGTMQGTRFSPDQLPTDLGLNDAGFLFYGTDATQYFEWTGTAWKVLPGGFMSGGLAAIPTGLGLSDKGFIYEATDYEHMYRWTGTAWAYAHGDPGSGWIGWYTENPNTNGWRYCDGSTGVSRSLANGTIGSVNMPDFAAGAYPKGVGAYTGAIVAAIAPIFNGLLDSTSGASAAVSTGSGTGGLAAAFGHIHTVTPTGTITATAEPAEIGLLAYYRL